MKTKHKKIKKSRTHIEYNEKEFLAKSAINSMSAIHTKIYNDGTAIIRISDCHGTIKLWNDMNDPKEVQTMLEKTSTLIKHIEAFREEVVLKSNLQFIDHD